MRPRGPQRPARCVFFALLLTALVTPLAHGAGAGRYAGIYAGQAKIALSTRDYRVAEFPYRLTVFPDRRAMILGEAAPAW